MKKKGGGKLKNRIKELRKTLNLTQNDFGKEIGITGATVSDIERGKLSLTDRNVSLICEKYNVNKDWILYGNGEMFLPELPEDEFTKILAEIDCSDDEFIKQFLRTYWELDEDGKKVIQNFAQSLAQKK
ncbi:helix-turn-helix domain-containing protein [Anaerotignum sp.]|uniref:helix-turn-helix domain-containing protein n=1 Tax=Anaerotignum sp. TaxID=2039241 RepID=UPI0029DB8A00|nr:helix-turn-helix transcriptional regulator [Anaerotignum sp.]MCI6057055.1 helix-turn-helix domain-containing protein [Clostridia bacterium]MDY3597257.1 helix-turn-helix transcriptional regulator [Anaerotignum sp.]